MALLPRRRRYDEDEDQFMVDAIPPEVLPDTEMRRPIPLPGPPGYRPPGVPPTMPPSYRPTRDEQMREAEEVYLQGTQGRAKSGLKGALLGGLRGLATGNLGGVLGGAIAGGAYGAITPRGLRRSEFNQRIRPEIERRFAAEDQEAARLRQQGIYEQNATLNQARIADINADIDLKRSQAEENRLPRPVAGVKPEWIRGRNRRTGQFTVYNAADPAQNAEHEPLIEERNRWVVNSEGVYEDVIKAEREGRKVKALQRPRAAAKPPRQPKNIGISDVRAYGEEHGLTESQAIAKFANDGWTVRR